MTNASPIVRGPNATNIPPACIGLALGLRWACVGLALGLRWACVGSMGACVGPGVLRVWSAGVYVLGLFGFLDTNMLV